ncbi:hypothetical protein BaRGS_00021856 [Batillaria attramentaria]|uniref:Secreted protein n=1 Tax=Batillaria attramentaria TaxID=370345 RepID=A0ABD0KI89_9CAEN
MVVILGCVWVPRVTPTHPRVNMHRSSEIHAPVERDQVYKGGRRLEESLSFVRLLVAIVWRRVERYVDTAEVAGRFSSHSTPR